MPIAPSEPDDERASRSQSMAAAGQFSVGSERQGTTCVVGMSGELDLATAPRLLDVLRIVEASDAVEIVLDLSGLDFMDSSGLALVIAADARAKAAGKRLKLVRGQARVHRIFEITATVDLLAFVAA